MLHRYMLYLTIYLIVFVVLVLLLIFFRKAKRVYPIVFGCALVLEVIFMHNYLFDMPQTFKQNYEERKGTVQSVTGTDFKVDGITYRGDTNGLKKGDTVTFECLSHTHYASIHTVNGQKPTIKDEG